MGSPTRTELSSLVLVVLSLSLFYLECLGVKEVMGYPPSVNCAKQECAPYQVVHSQKEFEIRIYNNSTWMSSGFITTVSYTVAYSAGYIEYESRYINILLRMNLIRFMFINLYFILLLNKRNNSYIMWRYKLFFLLGSVTYANSQILTLAWYYLFWVWTRVVLFLDLSSNKVHHLCLVWRISISCLIDVWLWLYN